MSDAAIAQLLRLGPEGAVIVLLGGACYLLWKDHKAVQELRIADLKASQTQLMQNSNQLIEALTKSASSTEASKTATVELKGAFEDLAEEVRASRIRR